MTVLLKLLYAAAVTALFVLFVAFGIRTFYSPPEEPEFPRSLIGPIPVAPAPGVPGEPAPRPTLTPEQEQYQIEQQRYQDEYAIYRDELRDYRGRGSRRLSSGWRGSGCGRRGPRSSARRITARSGWRRVGHPVVWCASGERGP